MSEVLEFDKDKKKETVIYRIGAEVFEVEEYEMMHNVNQYQLKCLTALSKRKPNFTFGDYSFYNVFLGVFKDKQVLSLEEYKKYITEYAKIYLKEVALTGVLNDGAPFILDPILCSTRQAFVKYIDDNWHQYITSYTKDLRYKLGIDDV